MAGPTNGAEEVGRRAAAQCHAFTQLDDPKEAQRIADRFARLHWPKTLDRWADQVNPLLRELLSGYSVHWVVDQAEYATD